MANMRIKEHAKAGAAASAARRTKRAKLDRLLPPLTSTENAMERLDLVQQWLLSGLIDHQVAGALNRGVEIWLKGEQIINDTRRIKELEAEVVRLETEAKAART